MAPGRGVNSYLNLVKSPSQFEIPWGWGMVITDPCGHSKSPRALDF